MLRLWQFWCPRQESNLHYKHRKLASYPLNDEGNEANVTQAVVFSTHSAVFTLRQRLSGSMIAVMSRGNSIIASVVLIGILGTLSIALQATTPGAQTVTQVAAAPTVVKPPSTAAQKTANPQEIGCYKGYEYKVRKVGGKTQVSCTPTSTNNCKVNWSGAGSAAPNQLYTQERYNSAGAEECTKAVNANNSKVGNAGYCEWAGAKDCNLWHCFTPKGSQTETCVKVRNGSFNSETGFSPAANENFALKQLVSDAAGKGETAAESQNLLKALKSDPGMQTGVDNAFTGALEEQGSLVAKLAYCGKVDCTEEEFDKAFQTDQKEKLEKMQKLNDDLKTVAVLNPEKNPPCDVPCNKTPLPETKGPGNDGQNKGGQGSGQDNQQKPPTTGFGQPSGSGTQQKPASSGSGTSNPYQQCSPQYFCANSTLYWGSPQGQQQGGYPYYGTGCQNQTVQYCQYGCAQGNTTCAQNPQNASQQPAATLSCGGTGATFDVGANVPITFSCTNSTASTGSGFSTGGTLSGTASATIQKPPAGANTVSYGLTCTASNNQTASARCDVGINVPSIVMVANPKQVAKNASTTIGWVTKGMKECVIQALDVSYNTALEAFNTENAGNTAVSGVAVTPALTSDTTFNLACKTKTDQSKSATVVVKMKE